MYIFFNIVFSIFLQVLVVALLCVAAIAQDTPRGRERLRELVQKARAGDAEAQAVLATRRRKIVRNKDGRGNADDNLEGGAIEQDAVANILNSPASVAQRRPSFSASPVVDAQPALSRLPSSRTKQQAQTTAARSRARGGSRALPADVTTFRPFTTAIRTTEATAVATTSIPELSPVTLEEEFVPTEAIPEISQSRVADLTPTNVIPSLFQPAQFGPGGRGVQASPEPIRRIAPVTNEEPRQSPRPRVEPHRAINRGLEIGSRTEVNLVNTEPVDRVRTPPIQTTRRYSFFDDVGNYVFGYEAEDGSFKEEIRGLDCIVNGKYGYVDPDGIRREFTYVSGNKCDPNDPEGLNLPEGVTNAPNDQFLHQTQHQVLTETELAAISFNRRRQPVQQNNEDINAPLRVNRPRGSARPSQRQQALPTPDPFRPSPEPVRTIPERFQPAPERFQPAHERFQPAPEKFQPVPERFQPDEIDTANIAPANAVPSLFQPAQFGSDGRGVAPKTNQERFPVPDFLNNARPESRRPKPQIEESPISSSPRKETKQQSSKSQHVDLTPTNVIPSIFQSAQFGPGGRGVAPTKAVTRRPDVFNFEQEFSNVFSNFDTRGSTFSTSAQQPTPRPTPRHTQPQTTQPPTTRAPPPPPSNAIPSLFQPAQFGGNRPQPAPAPVNIPLDDNSFTLTQQQSSGPKQLVFDASTGTFKTVQLQSTSHFEQAALPAQPPPRPTQKAPRPTNPPPPPPQTTGRPLQLFGTNSGRNPLPPIPTSAADFDRFFASFPTSG